MNSRFAHVDLCSFPYSIVVITLYPRSVRIAYDVSPAHATILLSPSISFPTQHLLPHARSPTHPQHQHPHHSKPPPTWNCLASFVPLLPHALEQYVSWINGPNPPPSPPTHFPHQLTHPPTRGPMQNNAISALKFRLGVHADFCGPRATGG